jgi:ABC-type amino acid transport system permease subunit
MPLPVTSILLHHAVGTPIPTVRPGPLVALLKDSSLGYVVDYPELMKRGRVVGVADNPGAG